MNIWTIMIYELRRLLRSRSMLLNMFLLPMVLIFLLGSALSGVVGLEEISRIEPVRVGVVNLSGSGSESSKIIVGFLNTPELKDIIIPLAAEGRQAAESGLRTGKYGYAVIVPPGFDNNVLGGGEAQLEFILGKDSTENLVAGTVFDQFLSDINYKQAAALTLGPEVMAVSAPVVDNQPSVTLGKLNEEGSTYSASQFYAASMLLMFMLYSGMTVCTSLFNEKDNHTLFRINSMPVKGSQLFIGKILGIGLVTILQSSMVVLLTDWLYGVDWGDRPGLLILTCMLMIISAMTLSIIVALFFKTAASARSAIATVAVTMTFMSGGMFPLPESWVNSVGAFTINHWALQAILRMILHSELSEIMPNVIMLSLICFVLFLAAFISYRKVGYHE
ncbi:ABC transporter permease [Paenibacillus sp. BR2-3]|uniref:ABC transporter permease n=1 Tax=Paenibacillus sp. BR2-3 TaxID=3048494 RepID=UPI0039777BB6